MFEAFFLGGSKEKELRQVSHILEPIAQTDLRHGRPDQLMFLRILQMEHAKRGFLLKLSRFLYVSSIRSTVALVYVNHLFVSVYCACTQVITGESEALINSGEDARLRKEVQLCVSCR